jgi:hypothetical protein
MNKNMPDLTIGGHHLNDQFYFDKGDETLRIDLSPRERANEMAAKMGQNDAGDFAARYYNEQLLG